MGQNIGGMQDGTDGFLVVPRSSGDYTDTGVHWSGDSSDEEMKINGNQYENVNVSVSVWSPLQ